MACPNKNLDEWKVLENEFGHATALQLWRDNGQEFPSLEKAKGMVFEQGQSAETPKAGSVGVGGDVEATTKALKKLSVEQSLKDQPRYQQPAPDAGFRAISESTRTYVQRVLKTAFPGVETNMLSGEAFRAKFKSDSIGMVDTDGKVYINADKVNNQTQVHEFGHVWSSWAKRYAPKLYRMGIELAMADTEAMDTAKKTHPNLKGESIAEEVMAQMIGKEGGKRLEEMVDAEGNIKTSQKVIDFFKELWGKVKTFFAKNFQKNLPEDFQAKTIGEFSSFVANKLLGGQLISDLTSAEIADIESNIGVQRAMVANAYGDKWVMGPTGANTEHIVIPNWSQTSNRIHADLLQAIQKDLMGRPAGYRWEHVVKAGGNRPEDHPGVHVLQNWFGDMIESIKQYTNKRGWGEEKADPKYKTFTKDVDDAAKLIRSKKFSAEFEKVAEDINNGTFDPSTLPEATKKIWDGLIKTIDQAQYLSANGDAIIVDGSSKITAAEQQRVVPLEVSPFRAKIDAYKAKNKYVSSVIEFAENRLREIGNGQIWTKMMIGGKKGGLVWELNQAMTRASGTMWNITGNAVDMLKPLYSTAEWLKTGSQSLNPHLKLAELATESYGGIPLTTAEQFDIFMVLQQDNVRRRLISTFDPNTNTESQKTHTETLPDGSTVDVPNTYTTHIQSFGSERAGQSINITLADYNRLLTKFDQHWTEVSTTWLPASEYIYDSVNTAYQKEWGRSLAKGTNRTANQRWNVYYPMIRGEGADALQSFTKNHRYINDIGSQNYREVDPDSAYLTADPLTKMNSYMHNNAKYSAYAIPMRNIDVMISNNKAFFKDNKMEPFVEWWNETKAHISNGDVDMLGPVGNTILQGFIYSRLGVNPFVFLKQFTSVPLANSAIPAKYLFRAQSTLFSTLKGEFANYDMFSDWIGRSKHAIAIEQEMAQHSPYAYGRMINGTTEAQLYVGGGTDHDIGINIMGKNITKHDLLKYIKSADTATGSMLWDASKMWVEGDLGKSPADPGYWKAVEDKYMEAVIESQSSNDEWNRSMFAKKPHIINKALSLFAAQTFSNFNGMMGRAIDVIDNPNPITYSKLTKSFAHVFITSAAMAASVDALRQGTIGSSIKRKDEDLFEEAFLRETMQNVPVLGEIGKAVFDKYKNPVFSHDISHPAIEIMNNFSTMSADIIRGKQAKAMKEMVELGASAAGVPMVPIKAIEKVLQ